MQLFSDRKATFQTEIHKRWIVDRSAWVVSEVLIQIGTIEPSTVDAEMFEGEPEKVIRFVNERGELKSDQPFLSNLFLSYGDAETYIRENK